MNKKLIKQIMSVQSESYKTQDMQIFILEYIKELQKDHACKYTVKQDQYKNIYVTKKLRNITDTIYPTMVCHIDTVHEINNSVEVIEKDNVMFAMDMLKVEQYGIGGDDKVGIYITLEMLKSFDNFKAVFFLDEEVGCVGSNQADMSFFDDSTFILQCDRQGEEDFVNVIGSTKLYNNEIQDQILPILVDYNRKQVPGGMTDVQSIAKQTKCQVANMSCGYYNPHQETEFIDLIVVEDTLKMCEEILQITSDKLYRMERVVEQDYNYYDTYDFDLLCPKCNTRTLLDDFDDQRFCISCNDYVYNIMETEEYEIDSTYNRFNII
jgi:tripeptide aminopeptidase